MNVEQEIKTLLLADGTVSGLIAMRLYPMLMPQGVTLPAISYQRVATAPINDLEGSQNYEWVRIQIDCWDDDYAGVKALAAAVRAAMLLTPVFGQLLTEIDDFESEEKLYRVILDFNVWNGS